jgi:hypothetical protein
VSALFFLIDQRTAFLSRQFIIDRSGNVEGPVLGSGCTRGLADRRRDPMRTLAAAEAEGGDGAHRALVAGRETFLPILVAGPDEKPEIC